MTFRPDKTAPTAIIQVPNTANVYVLDTISGTAADSNTLIKKVQVAYYSVTDAQWWNPATAGTFNLGDGVNPPPETAFVDASTNTATPVNWSVTGSSVPVFTDSQNYRIFARAMDSVGNKTAFPGAAGVTIPPAQSAFIQIQKVTPAPVSAVLNPIAGAPYYKPTVLTVINGTLSAANAAQIRIINETPSPDTVWATEKCLTYTSGSCTLWDVAWTPAWVSTVTWLAGCADNTYVVGQSTCGFFGVDSVTGSDWSKNVSGI